MNTEFIWTDELVEEFAKTVIAHENQQFKHYDEKCLIRNFKKSKEAEYILLNKPVLSVSDILECMWLSREQTGKGRTVLTIDEKDLINLAKSKITQSDN